MEMSCARGWPHTRLPETRAHATAVITPSAYAGRRRALTRTRVHERARVRACAHAQARTRSWAVDASTRPSGHAPAREGTQAHSGASAHARAVTIEHARGPLVAQLVRARAESCASLGDAQEPTAAPSATLRAARRLGRATFTAGEGRGKGKAEGRCSVWWPLLRSP
eukprot:6210031-Pleurochrysis_carterae.AAC.1